MAFIYNGAVAIFDFNFSLPPNPGVLEHIFYIFYLIFTK